MSNNKEFEFYPSNQTIVDLRNRISTPVSKTRQIFNELRRIGDSARMASNSFLSSDSSQHNKSNYDTERWYSPRSEKDGLLPPRNSMFTPSRLHEITAKQNQKGRKPYWRCPMPTERRLAVSKSDQIFFDAFKTDSNDQAKPLEKYLSSEAKSVPTVSVHVQPKPMKSFHRRKLEDGLKPNTFTVGDDELIEHAENAKVESELEKVKPLPLHSENIPQPGFLRQHDSYVFTFPLPVKRQPKFVPPTPKQPEKDSSCQTEEFGGMSTSADNTIADLQSEVLKYKESDKQLKETICTLTNDKCALEEKIREMECKTSVSETSTSREIFNGGLAKRSFVPTLSQTNPNILSTSGLMSSPTVKPIITTAHTTATTSVLPFNFAPVADTASKNSYKFSSFTGSASNATNGGPPIIFGAQSGTATTSTFSSPYFGNTNTGAIFGTNPIVSQETPKEGIFNQTTTMFVNGDGSNNKPSSTGIFSAPSTGRPFELPASVPAINGFSSTLGTFNIQSTSTMSTDARPNVFTVPERQPIRKFAVPKRRGRPP